MSRLVSIIIPCYNDAVYISKAVQSAISQTYPKKEIIVIDDGSNLETKKILKEIEPKINLLITQENLGVCLARNNAIACAKGEFILTLDSDDFFEPKFLEEGVQILENNEEIGMVTCFANIIENNNVVGIWKPTGSNAYEAIYKNNAIASLLFRKQCWKDVGGYDLKMKNGAEDWEFNISVTKAGWKIFVIEKILFNYRRKQEFSRNVRAKHHEMELRRYVFNKHKDLLLSDYGKMIDFFLGEIDIQKKNKQRILMSKSYILGHRLIKPYRWLKNFIK